MSQRSEGAAAPTLRLLALAALVALHALLFFLCFPPVGWWPLAFFAAAPLAIAVRDASRGLAFLAGFLGFGAAGAASVFWLSLLGPAPWLGTAFGFALYGLLFALWGRAAARTGIWATLWVPVVWCAIEHLRGTLFFYAFPWVYLGHAAEALPMVQAADLGGQNLVSFAVALGSGFLVDVVDARRGRYGLTTRRSWRRLLFRRGGLVVAALLALNVYGLIRPSQIELEDGPRVLCVQSNIPQELKNASEMDANVRLKHLVSLTEQGVQKGPVDVIAWPETMLPVAAPTLPGLRYEAVDRSPVLQEILRDLGARTRTSLLAGSLHAELREGEKIVHNSLFLIGPDGRVRGRYDKVFLAPMSEAAPLREAWPAANRWLHSHLVPAGFTQFEAGESHRLFEISGYKIAGSICFDVAFARASRESVRAGAVGIINVSNYAWFQGSAELDLARTHTRFRAIETRRALCCAVNGGITHFADARGRVTDLVAPDGRRKEVAGTLLLPLRTSRARTLFLVTGELFAWLLVGASFLLFGWGIVVGRRADAAAAS